MKKVILVCTLAVLMFACKSTSATSTNTDRKAQVAIKGNWEISSVDYDKNYRVKPFDEGADAQCWVGSQWKLVPNNYTGTYSINGGSD